MADRHIIGSSQGSRRSSRTLGLIGALFSAGLCSCAGQPVRLGSTVKSIPAEQALVMPPPAGPGIVSVIERRYDNAIEQEIHLTTSAMTSGQNKLTVQLFGTAAPFKMASNTLTSTPLTATGVSSEMRKALPGVRMSRSNFYVQNSYGPFGYAFGRGTGSDLCIYGWQQVRSPTGTISPFANYGSIQIRLRVCEAGATEQKLLAIMYHYTILGAVDAGGWNPYGEPGPVSPSLGGTGAPTYPRPVSTEPMVPPLPQRQTFMMNRAPMMTSSVVRQRPAATVAVASGEAPSTEMTSRVPSPTADRATDAASNASPSVVVPSPAGSTAATRVTVPSPGCTAETGGAGNACR